MIPRWSAGERNFLKIVGYRAIAKLDAALRAHDVANRPGAWIIENRLLK
jgi:hypothetical protein